MTQPQPDLTAREVYQLLKDLALGVRQLRAVSTTVDGALSVDIDGWQLLLGLDGQGLDHCTKCRAEDGRVATQIDAWPRFGTDPVSFLSVWERARLEQLFSRQRLSDAETATGIPAFTTARLLLTPLEASDAPAIQKLFPQWDIVRYLDSRVPWPYPEDGAMRYLRDQALPAIAQGKEWHWMISLASVPEQRIGSICLYDQPGNHRGFWLAPQWQGQGYMREACEVINHYWFVTLDRDVMQVPKAVGNSASRRISEREGMRLIGTSAGDFVGGRFDKETWELRRDTWLQQRRANSSINAG